ncbi:MAG: 5-formyltetrahydrofolate cyclo-ligase [Hydrogenovibrio sp.]
MNLRQTCRQKRRQLSQAEQQQHARQACRHLLRSAWLQRPKRIAVYLPQDGELSTLPLIQALWQRHHQVYLPVLQTLRGRHMAFARYQPQTPMKPNQFGIVEPHLPHQQHRTGQQLDLVIMPLTCFDESGHRIGMGGGFYDRTFQFKQRPNAVPNRPRLIGWAHECQKVATIAAAPWDLPMDALITEKRLYRFR